MAVCDGGRILRPQDRPGSALDQVPGVDEVEGAVGRGGIGAEARGPTDADQVASRAARGDSHGVGAPRRAGVPVAVGERTARQITHQPADTARPGQGACGVGSVHCPARHGARKATFKIEAASGVGDWAQGIAVADRTAGRDVARKPACKRVE